MSGNEWPVLLDSSEDAIDKGVRLRTHHPFLDWCMLTVEAVDRHSSLSFHELMLAISALALRYLIRRVEARV